MTDVKLSDLPTLHLRRHKHQHIDARDLITLYNQGLTLKQLSEHFGVSISTIYRHLTKIADAQQKNSH